MTLHIKSSSLCHVTFYLDSKVFWSGDVSGHKKVEVDGEGYVQLFASKENVLAWICK